MTLRDRIRALQKGSTVDLRERLPENPQEESTENPQERATELYESAVRVMEESANTVIVESDSRYCEPKSEPNDHTIWTYEAHYLAGQRTLTIRETSNDSLYRPCGEIEVYFDFTRVLWTRLDNFRGPDGPTVTIVEYIPGNPDIKREDWEGFLEHLGEIAASNILEREESEGRAKTK